MCSLLYCSNISYTHKFKSMTRWYTAKKLSHCLFATNEELLYSTKLWWDKTSADLELQENGAENFGG